MTKTLSTKIEMNIKHVDMIKPTVAVDYQV